MYRFHCKLRVVLEWHWTLVQSILERKKNVRVHAQRCFATWYVNPCVFLNLDIFLSKSIIIILNKTFFTLETHNTIPTYYIYTHE